jgi:hypothetical protein
MTSGGFPHLTMFVYWSHPWLPKIEVKITIPFITACSVTTTAISLSMNLRIAEEDELIN